MKTLLTLTLLSWLVVLSHLHADPGDWLRLRGPNGSGKCADGIPIPIQWDTRRNLKWQQDLPGPGQSSPIIIGDRIVLTCWTGYGLDEEDPGDQQDMQYHLVCIDRKDGSTQWSRTIQPSLPEHRYGGMLMLHGYATHTPVSDGETIFAFFGKTGVFAFDLDGNQLWQTNVGTTLDSRRWGSSASPILHEDFVIVTASVEVEALVALDKATGDVAWRLQGKEVANIWGTPALVTVNDKTELVVSVPFDLWGIDPETGKRLWRCESARDNTAGSGVMVHGDVAYVLGARFGGTTAVRAGGRGDVTGDRKLWSSRYRGRTVTPIYHENHIYWIFSRVAYCAHAETGESLYRARLKKTVGTGGGPATNDYASPVFSDGLMYQLTRDGEMLVIELGPEYREVTRNRFHGGGIFGATPALSRGELFVRSSKHLYCVSGADAKRLLGISN